LLLFFIIIIISIWLLSTLRNYNVFVFVDMSLVCELLNKIFKPWKIMFIPFDKNLTNIHLYLKISLNIVNKKRHTNAHTYIQVICVCISMALFIHNVCKADSIHHRKRTIIIYVLVLVTVLRPKSEYVLIS
jgi:hypothetical protein